MERMRVALFFNQYKARVLTAYLYAEYPTQISNKSLLSPRSEAGFSWDAIEISDRLNAILSNMEYQNNFLELEEVKEIFDKYSEIARKKTLPRIFRGYTS